MQSGFGPLFLMSIEMREKYSRDLLPFAEGCHFLAENSSIK